MPASSCEVSRNRAQGWSTWTAENSQRLLYDAEQKFIFRVTSLYNFPAPNNIYIGFSGLWLREFCHSLDLKLKMLPLAYRKTVSHGNLEGKL